jgi:chromosome segregation ATPase
MRNHKLAVLAVAVLTLTVAAGCAKPPQQEIDALKASMTSAEQAEAPKYAADAWNEAQQSMNTVNAEVEAQANKFALFRSYTKTKELIADANQKAAAAQEASSANKEAARNAAEEALAAARASLDQATAAMAELEACRRKPKDFKKDMEMMQATLDGYAAQVAGIESAIASEDYFGARSQAESLTSSVDALVSDLQGAKERIRC